MKQKRGQTGSFQKHNAQIRSLLQLNVQPSHESDLISRCERPRHVAKHWQRLGLRWENMIELALCFFLYSFLGATNRHSHRYIAVVVHVDWLYISSKYWTDTKKDVPISLYMATKESSFTKPSILINAALEICLLTLSRGFLFRIIVRSFKSRMLLFGAGCCPYVNDAL